MTSLLRCSCALVALAIPGGAAHADAKQEADDHIAKATRAHEAGKFEEALAELTAAYKLDPRPELAYAIGQVDVKLGKCDDARAAYEKFLDATKDAHAKSLVEQALGACVSAEPPPKRARAGGEPEQQRPGEPPPKKVDDPAPVATRTVKKPFYKDVVGDALVLAGVASAVAGLVVYNGAVTDNDAAAGSGSLSGWRDLSDRASKKQTMAIVLGAGAAALIAGGILSYAMRDRTEVRRVAVSVGPEGGLVAWTGRF